MSARRALALGFREFLRSPLNVGGLAIATTDCDVMADGRPRPDCGDWFYAIHGGLRANQLQTGDESYFTLYCTISARTEQPFDRVGPNILQVADGLDDRADDVWNAIFRYQWTPLTGPMTLANRFMYPDSVPSTYLFVQSLYPVSCSNPEPVVESWFNATSQQQHRSGQSNTGEPAPFVGFKTVLTFQGAVIMQELDDALA